MDRKQNLKYKRDVFIYIYYFLIPIRCERKRLLLFPVRKRA